MKTSLLGFQLIPFYISPPSPLHQWHLFSPKSSNPSLLWPLSLRHSITHCSGTHYFMFITSLMQILPLSRDHLPNIWLSPRCSVNVSVECQWLPIHSDPDNIRSLWVRTLFTLSLWPAFAAILQPSVNLSDLVLSTVRWVWKQYMLIHVHERA